VPIPSPDERPDLYDAYDHRLEREWSSEYESYREATTPQHIKKRLASKREELPDRRAKAENLEPSHLRKPKNDCSSPGKSG
jgi:hypothetical protein